MRRLRSGIFLAPFHALEEDPTLSLRDDLELIEWLDRLGYDEAWVGEHHSGGVEIIASPELFIAAAAERTERIRLGTGVVSLPYHHPLMVASRIIQLDHQTRGRIMFGAGPGLLAADALQLGIDPLTQRPRMEQAIDAIVRLLRGETVTEHTDWYTLDEARLQLQPYSDPHPEITVASSMTPSGARLAGRYGFGLLSLAVTDEAGIAALRENWQRAEHAAREHGRTMDRAGLRLVGLMHLAESVEQARRQVRHGFDAWREYFLRISPTGLPDPGDGDPLDAMIEAGMAVVGTPDDAVVHLERLEAALPGFGCFLFMAHNWADRDATRHSYELFARYALPRLRGVNRSRQAAAAWLERHAERLRETAVNAALATIQRHEEERRASERDDED